MCAERARAFTWNSSERASKSSCVKAGGLSGVEAPLWGGWLGVGSVLLLLDVLLRLLCYSVVWNFPLCVRGCVRERPCDALLPVLPLLFQVVRSTAGQRDVCLDV